MELGFLERAKARDMVGVEVGEEEVRDIVGREVAGGELWDELLLVGEGDGGGKGVEFFGPLLGDLEEGGGVSGVEEDPALLVVFDEDDLGGEVSAFESASFSEGEVGEGAGADGEEFE